MTRERGFVHNHLTRRVGKDGRECLVSLSRSTLQDSSGAVVGWTAVLRDVTDQVRVEEELSRARSLAMIGELAATVAHEIKNPLAGIHGATQILLHQTPAPDGRREILEHLANEIRRLDATVRDLLRFSRPEKPRLDRRDIRAYVGSLTKALREDAGFAGVEFDTTGDSQLFVHYDERLLHQVLMNLFENARDAMEGKARSPWISGARGAGCGGDPRRGARDPRGQSGARLRSVLLDEAARHRARPRDL